MLSVRGEDVELSFCSDLRSRTFISSLFDGLWYTYSSGVFSLSGTTMEACNETNEAYSNGDLVHVHFMVRATFFWYLFSILVGDSLEYGKILENLSLYGATTEQSVHAWWWFQRNLIGHI